MKRIVILLITIFTILILIFSYHFFQIEKSKFEIQMFNKTFLEYNKKELYGTDITTVINKAMDNNEKYNISKNESGEYIPDDTFCVKIFIDLQQESEYQMENFYKVGINKFTQYFGMLKFECKKVTFHNNGRISEMHFEVVNL